MGERNRPYEPARNELGMRLYMGSSRRRWSTSRGATNRKDRAIREAFEAKVLSESCCIAAFQVGATTILEKVAVRAGLSWECPKRCPAYVAIFGPSEFRVRRL